MTSSSISILFAPLPLTVNGRFEPFTVRRDQLPVTVVIPVTPLSHPRNTAAIAARRSLVILARIYRVYSIVQNMRRRTSVSSIREESRCKWIDEFFRHQRAFLIVCKKHYSVYLVSIIDRSLFELGRAPCIIVHRVIAVPRIDIVEGRKDPRP